MNNEEIDYVELYNHLLSCIRTWDPGNFEEIKTIIRMQIGEAPKERLLDAIDTYLRLLHFQSPEAYSTVLDELQKNISEDIQGVQLIISPEEQYMYKRDIWTLAPNKELGYFMNDLKVLRKELSVERERGDDYQAFER